MRKTHSVSLGFACVLFIAFAGKVEAQVIDTRQAIVKDKILIVETRHKVSVTQFRVDQGVKPLSRSEWGATSDNRIFVSFISAMGAQDYDWWQSMWLPEDVARITRSGVEKERLLASWEGIGTRKPITILAKTELSKAGVSYTVYDYKINNLNLQAVDASGRVVSRNSNAELRQQAVFVSRNNRWFATQELASDAIFRHISELVDSGQDLVRVSMPGN
jgi:hypothetical protein